MKYKTFKENLMNQIDNLMKFDYSKNKKGRRQLLHSIFIILQKYFDENGKLPELNNEEESELFNRIEKFTKNIDKNEFFKDIPELNNTMIKDIIKFTKAQHHSLYSFLGRIVAQESIKYTGLYCPLNQWLLIDKIKL